MKWTIEVEMESDLDEEALQRVNEAMQKRGLSACIVTLASHIKGEGSIKYTDELASQVAALCLFAYLKAASDKR